jgi:hypothetical protein
VAGGIAHQVSFRLDNRSAARAVRSIANQEMPEQPRRNNPGRRLIKRARQWRKYFHPLRANFNGSASKVERSEKNR